MHAHQAREPGICAIDADAQTRAARGCMPLPSVTPMSGPSECVESVSNEAMESLRERPPPGFLHTRRQTAEKQRQLRHRRRRGRRARASGKPATAAVHEGQRLCTSWACAARHVLREGPHGRGGSEQQHKTSNHLGYHVEEVRVQHSLRLACATPPQPHDGAQAHRSMPHSHTSEGAALAAAGGSPAQGTAESCCAHRKRARTCNGLAQQRPVREQHGAKENKGNTHHNHAQHHSLGGGKQRQHG